jgi:hypothetical protein
MTLHYKLYPIKHKAYRFLKEIVLTDKTDLMYAFEEIIIKSGGY